MIDIDAYFNFVQRNAFIPEPPPERIFVGTGFFREVGCASVRSMIQHADLAQDSVVLDIGSGIGRVALPLTQWLTDKGRYLGIEIVTEGVSWCIENITSKYPNFRFVHADLHNAYYNPTGQGTTAAFKLPADDASFDIAVFCSVFTHLDGTDADAWLGHVAKALKIGGRIHCTWFIMDDESVENCRNGHSTIGLGGFEENGVYWQGPDRNPGAVGYAPWKMHNMFDRHGLRIKTEAYGSWSNRANVTAGYQDELILIRE